MNLLSAEQLSLQLGDNCILDGVSLQLHAGEILGLIGPNGAGKTTLLRVLAALQTADQGIVRWQNQTLQKIPAKQRARHIGYLAQGALAHWPLLVEKVVELGRLPYQQPWQNTSASDRQIIDQAIEQADINHLRQRLVTTLSGGERMRVMLARLFASQPQLILADEPVAALDPYHQLHIMELLRDHAHRRQGDAAVIVVLHDLNLAARFCDRLLLLKEGKLFSQGTPQDALTGHSLKAVYSIKAKRFTTEEGLALIPWQRLDG